MNTCAVCGRQFDPEAIGRRLFCSHECAIKGSHNTIRNFGTGECAMCGKEFVKAMPQQKYCCAACQKKAAVPRIQHECPVCGKKFLAPAGKKTCSKVCASQLALLKYRQRNHVVEMERTCPVCGETFLTTRQNKKYCSRECAARRKEVTNGDAQE